MPLAPGTRLGPYEVLGAIGSGGMGEVYRAHDTKLHRDVALKILPSAFTRDSDRVGRFRREAQVLASLNHPNIAAIYGLEESGGTEALVLELVEGPTLADRLAKGPLTLVEALPVAKQIADALETAHEQGIIHRDLKPANVKVKDDGTVKVLDFGLARLADPSADSQAGENAASPTVTSPARMTGMGVILGTAAYMSPEQARGRTVDKRADIWAFGVVLFEMLAGRRPFDGETISDVLAKVIEREPDWTALPDTTPPRLVEIIRRCLRKEPKARLRDIGDARVQIDELARGAPEALLPTATIPAAEPPRRPRVWALAAGALAIAAIAAAITWSATRPAPAARPQPIRFTLGPSVAQPFAAQFVVTPDGERLIYVTLAASNSMQSQLMVRAFDQLDAVPLRGTVGARQPFVSPDSKSVGFFTDREIRTVPISGGTATKVCSFSGQPRGATWAPDGTIIFATGDPSTGLLSVAERGGEPKVLTRPDATRGEVDHTTPSILPGGQAVLFVILGEGRIDQRQIAVLDLKSNQQKVLIPRGHQPTYVDTGHIVFADGGALLAVPFDLRRLDVGPGNPVPMLDGLTTLPVGASAFAVSEHGTLVYAPGSVGVAGFGVPRSLVWVDRQGREETIKLPTRAYTYPRISPDGLKLAVDIRDQESDIWIVPLAHPNLTRLTTGPASDFYPVWTPDGQRIVFHSNRDGGGDIYWQPADGTGDVSRLTMTTDGPHYTFSISPAGQLVYQSHPPDRGVGINLLELPGPSTKAGSGPGRPVPLEATAPVSNAEISPHGHWIAYQSNQSSSEEIFVRPFPNFDGGRWQISGGGGTRPVWSRDERQLFYLDAEGFLTETAIQATPTFGWSTPTRVLNTRYFSGYGGTAQAVAGRTYDVALDAKRFLMIKDVPSTESSGNGLVVVMNWAEELKARVPVK